MNTGGLSLRIKANVVELVLKFKYLSALSLFEVVEEGTNIYMHLMASPTHVLLLYVLCTLEILIKFISVGLKQASV
jgi:hypothetical protein